MLKLAQPQAGLIATAKSHSQTWFGTDCQATAGLHCWNARNAGFERVCEVWKENCRCGEKLQVGTLHALAHLLVWLTYKLFTIFFYRAHAAELGNVVPTEPLLFLKPTTSYVEEGGAVVVRPRIALLVLQASFKQSQCGLLSCPSTADEAWYWPKRILRSG